ncbi:HAMP domain-containing histidine kinase [Fulvivirga maritima]|uniref:sensor histidine kinase n=1 Tax=Fulvivirga maritima TaxID=2904247 RepID=UPI001F42F775|nr:HAMP domain-containing sensor histidine kinase [Fulvivirga maritima]UII28239.1 HAMP domain-containing histidine kinase [Fulvivirga maritima]
MNDNLNRDLTEANNLLEHFIYSCSHDLKGPLSSIKGLIHLAKLSEGDEHREQYLKLINESTIRMDRFIQSMENYLINAKEPVKKEMVDFQEIIDAIVLPMTPLIKEKGIKVNTRILQETDLMGDKNRIILILKHLIDNAICYQKATKQENFLDIAIRVNNQEANIEICDNGEGISKDNINDIFKMFFRSSENSRGSGLGLYLVKETLEKLKGSVRVVSSRGVGSNFIIKIPNTLDRAA